MTHISLSRSTVGKLFSIASVLACAGVFAAGCAPTGGEAFGSTAQAASDDEPGPEDNIRGVQSPDHEDSRNHQEVLTTREQNCYEFNIPRGTNRVATQALLPEGYVAAPLSATSPHLTSVVFIDYHCDIAIDRQQQFRSTTVSFVGVRLASRYGVPTNGYYILALTTTNPILAARYRQIGIPAVFDHDSVSSDVLRANGTEADVAFDISGAGIDHFLTGVTREPAAGPISNTASVPFYYESSEGSLRLTFANHLRPATTALTTVDFSGASLIVPLLASPVRTTSRFTFLRGSWEGRLEVL